MKKTIKKAIVLVACTAFFSTNTIAQCKNILKKADLTVMKGYEHCGNAKVAKMYSGDEASISQEIESSKRYRLMTVTQKRMGSVDVIILSTTGDTLGIKTKEENQSYWDLMLEKNQVVEIKISVPQESTTTGIDVSGCVAVILGEIENTDLVLVD